MPSFTRYNGSTGFGRFSSPFKQNEMVCLMEAIFLCPFLCAFCADVMARCALMCGHALSVVGRRFTARPSPAPPPPGPPPRGPRAALLLMASPGRFLARWLPVPGTSWLLCRPPRAPACWPDLCGGAVPARTAALLYTAPPAPKATGPHAYLLNLSPQCLQ
jgi:hypothetical protein